MEVLTHPMLDQLTQLGLAGMAQAFAELEASSEGATLTHADWLGLLVDREMTHRRDKRLAARLRYARLRHQAVVEDIDYRAPRGLDRPLFHKLASGEWIDAHDNLILVRPDRAGDMMRYLTHLIGKTYFLVVHRVILRGPFSIARAQRPAVRGHPAGLHRARRPQICLAGNSLVSDQANDRHLADPQSACRLMQDQLVSFGPLAPHGRS